MSNPFEGDRMQKSAKRKRAEAAAKKLHREGKFFYRPEYEIAEDIMNGLLTFSGKPTALGRRTGAYSNPTNKRKTASKAAFPILPIALVGGLIWWLNR